MINFNNYTKKIMGITLIVGIFLSLIVYRTFSPVRFENKQTIFHYEKNDLVLENNKISLNVDLNGARINKILFKEYNKGFFFNEDNLNNDFETGWSCEDTRSVPHRTQTKWEILEHTKDKLVLTKKIENIIFKKTFLLEGDKLILEDKFNNLNNQPDIVLYNHGGFYFNSHIPEDKKNNLISYNEKGKLIRIENKQINNVKKNTVSQNNDGWFGIEDNYFLLFCNSTNGEILTEMDHKKNKFFFLSNEIYLPEKKYVLYLLPKDKSILDKYNIKNVLDYDFIFFVNFFMSPIAKLTHRFFYSIEKEKGFVFALLMLVLIIILLNCLLIFLMEKENIKLKIHRDEKKFIENNYQNNDKQNHLTFFYRKHNIKILRIVAFPIIMYITWVILNKIINLHFSLNKISFLWLDNIFQKDAYSLINLYGLLPFSIPTIITKHISTDILAVMLAFVYYVNNSLQGNYMKTDNNPLSSLLPNDFLFSIISNIFLPLVIARNLTSCFLISIIIILIVNNLFRIIIEKYFEKKYL